MKDWLSDNLNVPVAVSIHVVKQFLIVRELIVPLVGEVVAEVVTKWDQQNIILVESSLLTILVQQQLGPTINTQTVKFT